MKSSDVIKILQRSLPKHTDLFNTTADLTGAALSNNTITFTANVDDLDVGDLVSVTSVLNGITVSTKTEETDGTKIVTATDHGLCDNDILGPALNFLIQGQPLYTARLKQVVDTVTLIVEFEQSFDIQADTLYLTTLEGFNGNFNVTAVDPGVSFDVAYVQNDFTPPMVYLQGGKVATKVRIAGAADMERFNAAYTKQDINECWLVVVPADNRTSRSREVTTDAISGYMNANEMSAAVELRQTHVEKLHIYAVIPSRFELAGRSAADLAEDIRFVLYKCIIGNFIPTMAVNGYVTATVPVTDSYFSYLTDNTTYTHEYVFERSVIIESDDTFEGDDQTAPFRGLELELIPCDHDNM